MSDLDIVELALLRVRDSYKSGDPVIFGLLIRLVHELRQLRHENDPHKGLGRSGLRND